METVTIVLIIALGLGMIIAYIVERDMEEMEKIAAARREREHFSIDD